MEQYTQFQIRGHFFLFRLSVPAAARLRLLLRRRQMAEAAAATTTATNLGGKGRKNTRRLASRWQMSPIGVLMVRALALVA